MSDMTRYLFVILGGRGKEKFWVQILYRLSIIKLTRPYKPCFFPILLLSQQNIGKAFDEGSWVSAADNSATAKCAVTENGHYYVWHCYHSRSMRFRPISVWLSATLDVAESHKINTQSASSRKLTMISRSLLLLISNALVSRGNEDCKRYANLLGAESCCVLRIPDFEGCT
jgi:hypothetical protein